MREERLESVWHLAAPEGERLPLIFDSPHSGLEYPTDFRPEADMRRVRNAEDAHVDDLYGDAPDNGAVLLKALFPRIYIDPNRALDDLDPDQIDGGWPRPINPGPKSKLGVGLVWVRTRPNITLYDRLLTTAEIRHRIEVYHQPYHDKLKSLLDEAHASSGAVWHVNCHSMPAITDEMSPEGKAGLERPDMIIGTQDGTTAGPEFTERVRATLAGFGYDVRVDEYFKGVELIRAFSNPSIDRHSLQIEINRGLFMNEETGERSENYGSLRAHITGLVESLAGYAREKTGR